MKLKFLLFIFITFCFVSCLDKKTKEKQKTTEYNLTYREYIKNLRNIKEFKKRKAAFYTFINDAIPYYWTNTRWSFNGTSQIPKQGTIACGYFVTNTLSDFGFVFKRVYLAQQPSSVMIKQLCKENSIKHFSSILEVKKYLESRKKEEIYIVGLDFHTGFIIRNQENIYFLHSNYIDNKGVVKEVLMKSLAFKHSKSFMIGSISENEILFKTIGY